MYVWMYVCRYACIDEGMEGTLCTCMHACMRPCTHACMYVCNVCMCVSIFRACFAELRFFRACFAVLRFFPLLLCSAAFFPRLLCSAALGRFELLLVLWAGVDCSWLLLHALGFSRAYCQLITTTLPVRFVWCKPEVLGRRKEHLGDHAVCATQYAYVSVCAFSIGKSDSTCSVRLV